MFAERGESVRKSGKVKSREDYLGLCADILCKSLYRMCRENLKKSEEGKTYDPKLLKDIGSAVKEAAAVVSGIEKKKDDAPESIRVVFEDTNEYCE